MIKKEITSIIQSRKSVYPKEFNGEIIKDKDIIQLLENANHAPSHKMTQPWRFKIFCQNSKKKLLNEIMKLFQSGKKLPQLLWRYKIFGFHAQKVRLEDIGARQNIQENFENFLSWIKMKYV